MRVRFGFAVGLLVVIAACVGDDPPPSAVNTPDGGGGNGTGDGGGTTTQPKIVAFTATPSTLPFGGGDVKLTFAIEGATSASIDHGVGDVLGKTSVDLKVAASTTYTLSATNAAGSVTATAKVEVADTITVSGKIVAGGQPLPNAAVVVSGAAPTTTNTVGGFTVAGVKPPYDLAVAAGTPVAVTVYKGLTRADPTVVMFVDGGPLPATPRALESVNGTVSGPAPPYNPPPLITVSGANRPTGIATAQPSGTFAMGGMAIADTVRWSGPATTVAAFHASVVLSGTGYYGKVENVALTDDGFPGSQNIAMNQVPMTAVTCSASGPATLNDGSRTTMIAGVRFTPLGGGYENFLPGTGALPRSATANLHAVTGATFYLEGSYNRLQSSEDRSFARKAVAAPTATISVALPDPPQPTAPAQAATNVTASTAFTFGALAGGIQRVTFYATGAPHITIVTKDTNATLPDLTPFGSAIPKSTLYEWRVIGHAPLASLDDDRLADTLDAPDGTLPPLDDVRMTSTKPRTFTTAP